MCVCGFVSPSKSVVNFEVMNWQQWQQQLVVVVIVVSLLWMAQLSAFAALEPQLLNSSDTDKIIIQQNMIDC